MYIYKEDIKVDKNALEEEWEKQTMLYDHYATLEAEAEDAKDKAKRKLDITNAQMDERVRTSPSAFGLDEPAREAAIKYAVMKSKEVEDAEMEYQAAKKAYSMAKIKSNAIAEQKKRSLSKLSDLFAAGYYDRRMPKQAKEQVDERRQREQEAKLGENPRLQSIKRRSKE